MGNMRASKRSSSAGRARPAAAADPGRGKNGKCKQRAGELAADRTSHGGGGAGCARLDDIRPQCLEDDVPAVEVSISRGPATTRAVGVGTASALSGAPVLDDRTRVRGRAGPSSSNAVGPSSGGGGTRAAPFRLPIGMKMSTRCAATVDVTDKILFQRTKFVSPAPSFALHCEPAALLYTTLPSTPAPHPSAKYDLGGGRARREEQDSFPTDQGRESRPLQILAPTLLHIPTPSGARSRRSRSQGHLPPKCMCVCVCVYTQLQQLRV